MGRLTGVVARMTDLRLFDQQRADCHVSVGEILALLVDVAAEKVHHLSPESNE